MFKGFSIFMGSMGGGIEEKNVKSGVKMLLKHKKTEVLPKKMAMFCVFHLFVIYLRIILIKR